MVRTTGLKGYSDVHYTHRPLVAALVAHFKPVGKCLDPFFGDGAFHECMPGAEFCEISMGKDFFDYQGHVDWIVSNPPFSILTKVFEKAFSVADNCVFLMGIAKYWNSGPRLRLAKEYGALKEIHHVGVGRKIGFDNGFPFAAMHFEKGYRGPIQQTWSSYTSDAEVK